MSTLKSLVKDTAVYGLSSMLGRFLNWLLTLIYVQVLTPVGMGEMTQLYAWTGVLLVVLTYGMETSFFRFANKSDTPGRVYSTTLISVGLTSLAFVALGLGFLSPISEAIGMQGETGQWAVGMLVLISALDAFCAIPLGYLRYAQRPWYFMLVRMGFVLFTVLATIVIYYVGIRENALLYILGINLVGCVLQLMMLAPTFRYASGAFDRGLLREMLSYAWPILLLGLVGIFNSQADKLLFPMLFDDPQEGKAQLGIYATCYKIAVVMVLFTQAFRYAYDPFVFAKAKEGGEVAKQAYASSMKYYLLFTLFIFLAVMSMLDLVKPLIPAVYHEALPAVSIIMLGQLMFGVYFNLSIWYKLTDRTKWGAILSILACLITVVYIVVETPRIGFMACAWAGFVANGLIMVTSYFLGQHYYPVKYPLGSMALYTALALGLWGIEEAFARYVTPDDWIGLGFNLFVLLVFVAIVSYREVEAKDIKALLAKIRHR